MSNVDPDLDYDFDATIEKWNEEKRQRYAEWGMSLDFENYNTNDTLSPGGFVEVRLLAHWRTFLRNPYFQK